MQAFGNNAWKVRDLALRPVNIYTSDVQGEFAIPPSNHGADIGWYFTT